MLREGKPAEIKEMIDRMQSESRALLKALINLVYFMRGSISYAEMMWMTFAEREMIKEFLDDRFEIEKNRSTPIY
jgi:hypothetical protein